MQSIPGVTAQGRGGLGHDSIWEGLCSFFPFTDPGRDLLQGQIYQASLPQPVAVAAPKGCQRVPALSHGSSC